MKKHSHTTCYAESPKMQKVNKTVSKIIKNGIRCMDSLGSIKNDLSGHITFGSLWSGVILNRWIDDRDPMSQLMGDCTLLRAFNDMFSTHSSIVDISHLAQSTNSDSKLYRGTDYLPYYDLHEGDVIDYRQRYTSWTKDPEVTRDFYDHASPILLVFTGSARVWDLSKTRVNHEDECVMQPCKLKVVKVTEVSLPQGLPLRIFDVVMEQSYRWVDPTDLE